MREEGRCRCTAAWGGRNWQKEGEKEQRRRTVRTCSAGGRIFYCDCPGRRDLGRDAGVFCLLKKKGEVQSLPGIKTREGEVSRHFFKRGGHCSLEGSAPARVPVKEKRRGTSNAHKRGVREGADDGTK